MDGEYRIVIIGAFNLSLMCSFCSLCCQDANDRWMTEYQTTTIQNVSSFLYDSLSKLVISKCAEVYVDRIGLHWYGVG